ncbi:MULTISPECIES: class I SAM-dependent methyltransferase [Sphingobacterium]|uniref:class I SAM-dependent methyltransferase n=1 Tax=Sphingobacterium TaxID=28453 RepID=UPI00196A0554|nr:MULTISPECIES: class I SAM-dependent methyltransferase [unclassified Sphingobacterium]
MLFLLCLIKVLRILIVLSIVCCGNHQVLNLQWFQPFLKNKLSERLTGIVNALPINDETRILEIGCGSGAMAREISRQLKNGHILAIDRSAKAISQAISLSRNELESGKLTFRQIAMEDFDMNADEQPFDIAIAVRVGALDGRHPNIEKQTLRKIAESLTKSGKLFIDGGNPLKEIFLDEYRL